MRMLSSLTACSLAIFSVWSAPGAISSRAVVGAVVSPGSFRLANTTATGTATLLSGDEVQAASSSPKVMLKNGANFDLLPNSSSAFYTDHATLLNGTMRVASPQPYAINSGRFTVTAMEPRTAAVLQMSGDRLIVNVTSGSANVVTAGERLAHIGAGTTLSFDPYSEADGAAPADSFTTNTQVRLLGVLDSENGHYLVRDRFTNSVSEIHGQVSPKLLNHLVMVDGTWMGMEKSDLSQVDRVVQVSKLAPSDATAGLPCAADGVGGLAKRVVVDGLVNKIRNHFMVQEANKHTYEVVGDVEDKEIGTNIHSKGFVLPNRPTILPAEQVVYLENRKLIAMASPCVGAIVAGTLIGTSALVLPKNDPTAVAAAVRSPISF